MSQATADRDQALRALAAILSSDPFRRAERSSALLRFLVEQTLEGRDDRLKEFTIGAEVFDRGDSFDPRLDPIVRAEASRLRSRLADYYRGEGRSASFIIVLPRGSYVPRFEHRDGESANQVEPGAGPSAISETHVPVSRPVWIAVALGVAALV